MKLLVEIDAPEKEIAAAIKGIPSQWIASPGESPIRLLAVALRAAYLKAVDGRDQIVRCPHCHCPRTGALGPTSAKIEAAGYCVNCGHALDGSDRKLTSEQMCAFKRES